MTTIGLLSDTHGYLNPRILDFFAPCDEIWHAGDWGAVDLFDTLSAYKPLRGVWGNIDGAPLRTLMPGIIRFEVEKVSVLMTHIGGYPGKYDKSIACLLSQNTPKLFVCGHSHILKVMYDDKLKMLHLNPGAAGKYGFHHVSTALRFHINGERIENLEIIELTK